MCYMYSRVEVCGEDVNSYGSGGVMVWMMIATLLLMMMMMIMTLMMVVELGLADMQRSKTNRRKVNWRSLNTR